MTLADMHAKLGGVPNLGRAKEWFMPRYAAWKADPSKVITEAEVLEVWPHILGVGAGEAKQVTAPRASITQ
jgi:hypothetical protein